MEQNSLQTEILNEYKQGKWFSFAVISGIIVTLAVIGIGMLFLCLYLVNTFFNSIPK